MSMSKKTIYVLYSTDISSGNEKEMVAKKKKKIDV